jgi:hypothetical protein
VRRDAKSHPGASRTECTREVRARGDYFTAIVFSEVTVNTAFWLCTVTVTVKRCPPGVGTLLP